MASVRYTFTLDAIKDADVVRWLDSQPNTSAAIREALKAYVEKPTNAELGAKLDEVLNAIQTARLVTPAQAEEKPQRDEPEAAAKGFEKMMKRFKD